MGKFTPGAEKTAREALCGVTPVASLVEKGPGYEDYLVACDNGPAMQVRCEWGNCRWVR